jgi:methyl-accepting chemotaxis protein
MNSLSLKNKLILLVATLMCFLVGVGFIGFNSSKNIAYSCNKIQNDNLPSMTSLLESLAYMRSARIYLLELALPNQTEAFQKDMIGRIASTLQDYDKEDEKYRNAPRDDVQEKLYKSMKVQMDLVKDDIQKALEFHTKSNSKEGPAMTAMREIINVDLMTHGKNFREELLKLLEAEKLDAKNSGDQANEAQGSGKTWIIGGILLAVLLGLILSLIVLKNILADQKKAADAMDEAVRSTNMIANATNPMMSCDLSGKILSVNRVGTEQLRKLQSFIPEKVDNIVGKSVDVFHKDPAHIKQIIANDKNLPFKTQITIGNEKLNITVAAIYDHGGKYQGPMVNWEVVTEKIALVGDLTKAADDLAKAATNVLSISSNLSASAEETSAQANTASVASEEVNAGVQTVASNMEEMVAAIKEITKTTSEAANMTQEAMRITKNTNEIINKLGDSSMDIGNVIKVISSIAQQTNLLALNATIEAARAGEAGKGFAVVANEVKELANQTAKATSEITKKIEAIQMDSKNAVSAIADITQAIEKVNGYNGNIAASVEEQAATTNEVTRIVTESAEGVKQINENISQVSTAAASTGKDAGSAQVAAKNVGEISELLKKYVSRLSA